MNARGLGMVLCGTAVLLAGCGRSASSGTATVQLDQVNYQIEGPYAHENMTVFLLCSREQDARDFITLDEGLKEEKVKVSEKTQADVGELVIDNQSDRPLFLQEGDRLQGGQQDRIIIASLVVPPKSGPMPLPSFCIEAGRWTEGQTGRAFVATHNAALATKEVRNAAKINKNQQEVWQNVAEARAVARNVVQSSDGVRAGIDPGTPASGGGLAGQAAPAAQAAIPAALAEGTSLNSALDAAPIKKISDEFAAALSDALKKHPDAVGVAIAVNGQVEEVNIYPNHRLLEKLYPRLLQSYAFQATAQKDKGKDAKPLTCQDVSKWMVDGKEQKKSEEDVNKDNRLQIRMVSSEKPGDAPKAACTTEYLGTAVHRQIVAQPVQAPGSAPQPQPSPRQTVEPNVNPPSQAPAPPPPSAPPPK